MRNLRVARVNGELAYILEDKPHISACEIRPQSEGWGAATKRVPMENVTELVDFERVPTGHEGREQIHYKGLFFDGDTPHECILALYRLYKNDKRVVLDYGDLTTGRSWGEENDITGRVHCSMGPVKIPILVYNRRSSGGGGILTGCILSIRETGKNGRLIYKHKAEQAAA
jgi:hypothetical protein